VRWTEDLRPAQWVVDSLTTFGWTVASLVPDTFEAYARIPNDSGDRTGVLDEGRFGRLVEVLAMFTPPDGPWWFAAWDGYGFMTGPPAVAVARATRGATRQPVEPQPPLWYTDLPAARLRLPDRTYAVMVGTLAEAGSIRPGPFWQSPNLWWPEDRSCLVATEIDLTFTYVGGTAELIEALLGAERVDARRSSADEPIGIDAPER